MGVNRMVLCLAAVALLMLPARAEPAGADDANEPPLVVSYRTIICDRPPCLPIRSASRPPDFDGSFTLYQQVSWCRRAPCPRPYGAFVVTAAGLVHLPRKVVLHGERRKSNIPYYYTHRIRDGEVKRELSIDGEFWFDREIGRMEILARRIHPPEWELGIADE